MVDFGSSQLLGWDMTYILNMCNCHYVAVFLLVILILYCAPRQAFGVSEADRGDKKHSSGASNKQRRARKMDWREVCRLVSDCVVKPPVLRDFQNHSSAGCLHTDRGTVTTQHMARFIPQLCWSRQLFYHPFSILPALSKPFLMQTTFIQSVVWIETTSKWLYLCRNSFEDDAPFSILSQSFRPSKPCFRRMPSHWAWCGLKPRRIKWFYAATLKGDALFTFLPEPCIDFCTHTVRVYPSPRASRNTHSFFRKVIWRKGGEK